MTEESDMDWSAMPRGSFDRFMEIMRDKAQAIRDRDEARETLARCEVVLDATAKAGQQVLQERDEAREWAIEFRRLAREAWQKDWSSDDIDKILGHWPRVLPDWLKETP
jgi:hypothetical protein